MMRAAVARAVKAVFFMRGKREVRHRRSRKPSRNGLFISDAFSKRKNSLIANASVVPLLGENSAHRRGLWAQRSNR